VAHPTTRVLIRFSQLSTNRLDNIRHVVVLCLVPIADIVDPNIQQDICVCHMMMELIVQRHPM
jgi:hypothetical protein